MAQLTPDQLLLLDNLIYLNGVVSENNSYRTVENVVNSYLDENSGLSAAFYEANDTLPAHMDSNQWLEVLTSIQNDSALMNLEISHGIDNFSTNPDGGMRAAFFVDSSGDANVIFRGTGGAAEWYDNAMVRDQNEYLKQLFKAS